MLRNIKVDNLFPFCELLVGKRHVKVADWRTRKDWAELMQEISDILSPDAQAIVLVSIIVYRKGGRERFPLRIIEDPDAGTSIETIGCSEAGHSLFRNFNNS